MLTDKPKTSIYSIRTRTFWLWIFGGLLLGFVIAVVPIWMSLVLAVFLAVGILVLINPKILIFVLAFLIPFQIELELQQLAGITISPATIGSIGIVLLVFLSIFLTRRGFSHLLRMPYIGLWIVYLVLSSLAIAIGPLITSIPQGIWATYRIVWSAPLIYPGIWVYLRSATDQKKAVGWLALGATAGAAVAIVQTISGGHLLSGLQSNFRYLGFLLPLPQEIVTDYSGPNAVAKLYTGNIFRGHGTFTTSNGFGVLLSSTILITWGLMRSTRPQNRWFWTIALFVQVVGVFATFSRSAWAGVLGGVLVLVVWNFRDLFKKRSTLTGIILLIFILLVISVFVSLSFQSFLGRFLTIFTPTNASAFIWRIHVWQYAGKEILANPLLGTGTSMIDNSIAQIPGSGLLTKFSSHNMLIDIAYQRGIILLFIFLIFLGIYFQNIYKLLRTQKNTPNYELILGFMAAGFTFLVSGVGSASMESENLATLFWFLFGSVVAIAHFPGLTKSA